MMTFMKHLFLSFLSLICLTLAGVAIIFGFGAHHYLSPAKNAEPSQIIIKRGSSVHAIAEQLKAQGVITYPLVFKASARFGDSLKAGEYLFPARASIKEVITLLRKGEVIDRKVTLIEGLTSHQIVKRLNALTDIKGDKITKIPAEGSLLPNTYHYQHGDTRQDMINRMQKDMRKSIDELWPTRVDNLPISTKSEAIILASIIEKETAVAYERARVAGVFINRLRKGMLLQTDPTVIYALTKGDIQEKGKGPLGRRLLRKDLSVDSQYNTYKYTGLPPGPIANPGRASIAAALNPEKHDYIFFVADGTGGHKFAKTLREHNENVRQWRKVRGK